MNYKIQSNVARFNFIRKASGG